MIVSASYSFAEGPSFQNGIYLKGKGRFAEAEEIFRALLRKEPKNSNLWFQLGLAQRFQKKFNEALNSQKIALQFNPKSYKINMEIARIYYWTGQLLQAQESVENSLKTKSTKEAKKLLVAVLNKNERNKIKRIGKSTFAMNLEKYRITGIRSNRFYFGYENSHFIRAPRPDWHRSFATFAYSPSNRHTITIELANERRTDTSNRMYELGLYYIFSQRANGYIKGAYSPNYSFLPEMRVQARGEYALFYNHKFIGDTRFSLHGQFDEYINNIEVATIKPGLDFIFFKRIQIFGQYIRIFDNSRAQLQGWLGKATILNFLKGLDIYGGYSKSPETVGGVSIETITYFGGISYAPTDRVTLKSSYAREDRESSYIRNVFALSMSLGL